MVIPNDEIYNELNKKFDECPQLPESLSKENVVAMLKDKKQENVSRIRFKNITSVAAVAVLAVITAFMANTVFFDKGNDITIDDNVMHNIAESQESAVEQKPESSPPVQLPEGLRVAKSREEIENIILKNNVVYDTAYDVLFDANIGVTAATGSTANINGSVLKEEAADADDLREYGETNTQTKNVDEADIIKNDGRYLYVVGYDMSNNRKLRIIDAQTMTAVYNGYIYNESGDILNINDIYVNGNTLVAMGTYGNNYYGYRVFVDSMYSYSYGAGGKTVSVVMDITDRSQPKTLRKITQDGSYISSRMVGTVLYTLTEYTVSGKDEEEAKNNSVPEVAGTEIKCECIYIADEASSRYICLTAYDTSSASGDITSLAVLGNSNEVYCSENNFYVIGTKYINLKKNEKKDIDIDRYTVINAFALNGTSITFRAQGEVKGMINDQYSLDEYGGNLRIATTAYSRKTGADICSLYVLDSDLKTVGQVENIAHNEQIKSVRYMGDTAYVVTFRNTDPLFVIDLKDPTKPAVKGELKLPGYSAYMHPISDTMILGIGYNGDSQNADFTSLKVSIFDVSDMSNPKEISTLTYDNCCSYVVDDPKAFLYNKAENYIVLPVEIYSKYELSGYACYVISLENNVLSLEKEFKHEVNDVYSGITFLRGTYIDDAFFTVSDNLTMKYNIRSGEKLGECRIYEEGKPLQATTAPFDQPTDDANTSATKITMPVPPYNPNN